MQITVGEFIDKEEWGDTTGAHCIYVVRDGDTVFYVGQSASIIQRLWGHMGNEIHGGWASFGHRASDLGRLIRANLPQSRDWIIDLLTLKECKDYTVFNVPALTVDMAEVALINILHPCLNRYMNLCYNDDRLASYELPWKISTDIWPDFDEPT